MCDEMFWRCCCSAGDLFRTEESGVGTAGSYTQGHFSGASGAISLVACAFLVPVDSRVDAATLKMNAHPGSSAQRIVEVGRSIRLVQSLDFKMIRWFVHIYCCIGEKLRVTQDVSVRRIRWNRGSLGYAASFDPDQTKF